MIDYQSTSAADGLSRYMFFLHSMPTLLDTALACEFIGPVFHEPC